MGNSLYLECGSGISGDMFVAAMLDLGADEKKLKEVLESLPVKGFTTKISRVKKSGLDACDFAVILDAEHENHDHDMEYLHGQAHAHSEENHPHGHEHNQTKKHLHDHGHTHHSHEHRGPKDILRIIEHSCMSEHAKEIAQKIIRILSEAEAKAHGVSLEQVHFHEVGAVDSIVDIAAAAVCADNLNLSKVYVTQLNEGSGMVRCQHGLLPIPVPAVANVVSAYQLPLHITQVEGELVTPTGAAIAAALCTDKELPETFTIKKIGMGAGKREYACVGVLRAMLIEES